MTEIKKTIEVVDFTMNDGEIKGNASNNNLLNRSQKSNNQISIQSASGTVSGGGQVHSRIVKKVKNTEDKK